MTVLERGWLSSNNVLFDDGDAVSIVDTGYVSHAPQTLALVDAARCGRPLTRIVNTHLHSDHVGGNALLKARFAEAGCTIAMPAGLAAAVAAWDEEALTYAPTGQQPAPTRCGSRASARSFRRSKASRASRSSARRWH
jgi:glyoxylase-like metal-dependent hydrolase (beta-lactamase superfamily II)